MRKPFRNLLFVVAVLGSLLPIDARTAADEPAEPPKVALCSPLGVTAGKTTKITLRGWQLDQASEVKCGLVNASIKIVGKSAAPVPGGQDAKQIGDTQIELEVTIPDEGSQTSTHLTVTTPSGTSMPHEVFLNAPSAVATESEPNDSFAQALSLELPQTIEGSLHGDQNVDVFMFEAEAGQVFTAEVFARRYGSGLDSLLILFDSQLQILQTVDDFKPVDGTSTTDSRLEFRVPTTGRYYLTLQDANDHGGPAHPWRLVVGVR